MPNMRTYPQKARDRIKASLIINKLVAHVNGENDLTPTQVRAASILLNKVLPDVKSVEVDIHARLSSISYHRLTDEQLMAIASGAFNPEAIEGQCEAVQEPLKLVGDK
jgi:hypothetical protein